jgi:phosphocarrier protein HPr
MMIRSCEATVTIENELGLHARAATVFVQVASKYRSDIFVTKDGREINGKSMLGVLTLIALKGTKIRIRAEGVDASEAIAALKELVAAKFGENH